MKTLHTIILLLFTGTILAQSSKQIIEVHYNLYATGFDNQEYLYQTRQLYFKQSKKVNQLLTELDNIKSINQIFRESKVDTILIKENPGHLIKFYDNKNIGWNTQQVNFISKKLSQIETYKKYFENYLELGCCVRMHQRYRDEYLIKVFENGTLINTYTSRKSLPNSKKIPWTDNKSLKNYNPNIDKLFFEIIGSKKQYQKLLVGNELTKHLVTNIIDFHKPTLYELSAYDYYKELNELKSDFEILNIGEVYGRGRYIWNEPKTYYARLTNNLMMPQVNIVFLATKKGKTIYSRDSIKSDYKNIINRVQNVEFLMKYLTQNQSAQLDIYYFNNKPINDYNIDNFNKNPQQWVKHDKFLESIKKYENVEPKPTYANEDAIRVSKQLYCGCNFRFEKEFAEKAIFIELNNKEKKENSSWYLLPDNRILLYLMQGEKVLEYNYTDFGKSRGLQYPCVLFDLKGNIIDRKYISEVEDPKMESIQIRDFEKKDSSIMDTIEKDSIDMRIDSEIPNITIHDSSQYSAEFIKNLKDITTHRFFELIEDKIIVDNKETMEFPYYPFHGDTLHYTKEYADSSVYLSVMRINQTTITYELQMLKFGKTNKVENGLAHLNPHDIIDGDGFSLSEDEDGELYWSVFFRNQKSDGCFTDIYIGANKNLTALEKHCVSEFRYNSEKNFINLEQINKEE